mmetsp:Transcript_10334/g.11332  ORF Transcript_10334/g.11332 Transcript_10334/m.11332 type:complete len:87 (-) Transcript_10334:40-300(-)|eukprot:Skav214217  [mRNA]  locus=scaffold489:544596:560074:- [translate_table: standard]
MHPEQRRSSSPRTHPMHHPRFGEHCTSRNLSARTIDAGVVFVDPGGGQRHHLSCEYQENCEHEYLRLVAEMAWHSIWQEGLGARTA